MVFLLMSLSASFMILTILLLRKVFLYKIPSIVLGLAWGTVFLRLLFPYEIFTRYNFYHLVFSFVDAYFPLKYKTFLYNDLSYGLVCFFMEHSSALLLFWAAGACATGFFFAKCLVKAIRLRKESVPMVSEQALYHILQSYGLNRTYDLRELAGISSPIACGTIKPTIIFPKDFVKNHPEMTEQALLHEYMHLKYYHPMIQTITALLTILFWFHPLVWLLYHYTNRDMEIACDRGVLSHIGRDSAEKYALHLVQLAASSDEHPKQAAFYSGFAKSVLKERMLSILRFQKTSPAAALLSVMIPLVIAVFFWPSDAHIFGGEIAAGLYEITIENTSGHPYALDSELSVRSIPWRELKPYATTMDTRIDGTIFVQRYPVEIPSDHAVQEKLFGKTQKEGTNYSGILTISCIEIREDRIIVSYDGMLCQES